MSERHFHRALLVACDASGYGSRDDMGHLSVQAALLTVLDEAAEEANLNRFAWDRQSSGDGELAILPPEEPEKRVVDDFIRELINALRRYNSERLPHLYLRLRVAIHHGFVKKSSNGFAGQGVVAVSRLLDCAQLKAVMSADLPTLGLILSEQVHVGTIAQCHTGYDPNEFLVVDVVNKEYKDKGYIWRAGHRANTIPDDRVGFDVKAAASTLTADEVTEVASPREGRAVNRSTQIEARRRRHRIRWSTGIALVAGAMLIALVVQTVGGTIKAGTEPVAPPSSAAVRSAEAVDDGSLQADLQPGAVPLARIIAPPPERITTTLLNQIYTNEPGYRLYPRGCAGDEIQLRADLSPDGGSGFDDVKLTLGLGDEVPDTIRTSVEIFLDEERVEQFVLAPSQSQVVSERINAKRVLRLFIKSVGQGDCVDQSYDVLVADAFVIRR